MQDRRPSIIGVAGFIPTVHGLRFANSWPPEARIAMRVPLVGRVAIGRASRGLCGGMVFTALDVFNAGMPPLVDGRPVAGSPLFDYIVRRLFDSFNLPGGVARYYCWMQLGNLMARTIEDEWPAIKADLDAGKPCPLGLVTVRSANPAHLGRNHQVLAWGYHVHGRRLRIRVYDPNSDPRAGDDVWVDIDLSDPEAPGGVVHTIGIEDPVRGLFRVPYRPTDPRPELLPGHR